LGIVAVVTACQRADPQVVLLSYGFTGPVVVVAHAPEGLDAFEPIEVDADGIGFTRMHTRAQLSLQRDTHYGGLDAVSSSGAREEASRTECGCYSRWLVAVDGASDDHLAARDADALAAWTRLRREHGACSSAEDEPCPRPSEPMP